MTDDRFINHPPREFNPQEVGSVMAESQVARKKDARKLTLEPILQHNIPLITERLNQHFQNENVGDLFDKGKTVGEGDKKIVYQQLTNKGRQTAQKLFESLQVKGEALGLSSGEKAQLINRVSFDQSGLDSQQDETVRRSLRAQLIVAEAKKLNPDANPWKVVREMIQSQLADDETEISAFQALDRALEEQAIEQEKRLAKLIGAEKTQTARGKWDRFNNWIRGEIDNTIRDPRYTTRRRILTGFATLGALALIDKATGFSKQRYLPLAKSNVPLKTGRFGRRDFLRGRLSQKETPVEIQEIAVANETPTPPPTEAPPLPTETPAPTEVTYREIRFQEGQTYTFTLPTSFFAVEMTDIDGFNHPEADRKYMVATWFGLPGITTRQPDGVPQKTTINVHADYYQGKELPGTQLVKATDGELNPGDIVSVENQDGSVANLKYLGVVSGLDRSLFGETGAEEHQMAIDAVTILGDNPPAREAREEGKNIVAILTCTPGTRNSDGLYSQKTVLAFVPVQ